MRFPLNSKTIGGYRFQEWTFYNTKHTGTDWVANGWILYAPTNGRIVATPWDYGGGQWVNFQGDDGALHLFAHLSKAFPIGRYEEGQQIGVTGNTGAYTTGAHLHEQIYINGGLVDPEKYYEGENMGAIEDLGRYNQERFNENVAQDGKINDLYNKLGELKSQLDRMETTLGKILSDEVLQNAKLDGVKVEPQKGFWELLTEWLNSFKEKK